jgi:hypothetical protein
MMGQLWDDAALLVGALVIGGFITFALIALFGKTGD